MQPAASCELFSHFTLIIIKRSLNDLDCRIAELHRLATQISILIELEMRHAVVSGEKQIRCISGLRDGQLLIFLCLQSFGFCRCCWIKLTLLPWLHSDWLGLNPTQDIDIYDFHIGTY